MRFSKTRRHWIYLYDTFSIIRPSKAWWREWVFLSVSHGLVLTVENITKDSTDAKPLMRFHETKKAGFWKHISVEGAYRACRLLTQIVQAAKRFSISLFLPYLNLRDFVWKWKSDQISLKYNISMNSEVVPTC